MHQTGRGKIAMDRVLILIRMQPATVHRLAGAVEYLLAAVVRAENQPRFSVRELAFAENHRDFVS
jgi:hypothetical protein